MKKRLGSILILLLTGCLLFAAGCGPTTKSDQITKLDKQEDTTSKDKDKKVEPLKEKTKLPNNGIITKGQMETIAGKKSNYEFYASDPDSGNDYIWTYDGKKIQNPIEQKLKVTFKNDKVEEVKKAANDATVGLGFSLEEGNLAAPVDLKIVLDEKWDADSVILCKVVDNKPEKMSEAVVGTESKADKEVTSLTFPVKEMGDTYYLVGGKTKNDKDSSNQTAGVQNKKKTDSKADSAQNQTEDGENREYAGDETQEYTEPETQTNESSDEQQQSNAETSQAQQAEHTCTISIECSTILNNQGDLNKAKSDFVPSDGVIMASETVEYQPGETVYDVLYRITKSKGIHMEASYTPAYSSYYVEGINQLYEFDCGELSGWMYSVNGWFPNYGCSKYEVSDGDMIEWRYTCDLGRDVGDQYMGE